MKWGIVYFWGLRFRLCFCAMMVSLLPFLSFAYIPGSRVLRPYPVLLAESRGLWGDVEQVDVCVSCRASRAMCGTDEELTRSLV